MTKFVKKERDAQAAFQLEMNQFGLYVNSGSCCGMYSTDGKYFCLEVATNRQPLKGNKELIEKLKAAGYTVMKTSHYQDGRRYFVFWVVKIFRILREEDDSQEYVEQPERPVLIQPVIGKAYANRGGGLFRCLWSDKNGATFINTKSGWKFQAVGVRQYKDGTIEWDASNGGHFAEV